METDHLMVAASGGYIFSEAGTEHRIREHICALIEEQKPGSSIEVYATGEELLPSFFYLVKGIVMSGKYVWDSVCRL